MTDPTLDAQVRSGAFDFLAKQTSLVGDVLSWGTLSHGFKFDGQRVPLIGPQGIFKPAVLDIPLSVTTAPERPGRPKPYDDGIDESGLLNYRYRGTDPSHRDNVGLRQAMKDEIPLIYLFGVIKGQYMPVWPVFIVGDNPSDLCFKIAVDDRRLGSDQALEVSDQFQDVRRSYLARVTMVRLHQRTFHERVLRAYRDQCAICRLRHRELLEAAHILPDRHPLGEPTVSNGLALCKLHHAAFDAYILGIRPDRVIEIRRDILEEVDGPMLLHGLQGVAGTKLNVPRAASNQPKRLFLEERYELFRKAG